jgi:hypothetical protein
MSGFVPLEESHNDTSIVKHEPDYFQHIEMRYGIELEICIKFEPDCLKTTMEEYGLALDRTSFLKRFQIYFLYILAKVPREIRELYPLIGLQTSDEFYIFNLLDPLNAAKEINFHATNYQETMSMTNYEIPIFMEDITIVCGDADFTFDRRNDFINRNTGLPIELNKSMGIECVSPILKFRGVPEITKIKETLLPFLRLIGLDNNKCFISNKSSGYHVNVSALDTRTNTLMPITKYPLFLFVLQEFVLKEAKYYNNSFRVDPTMWARPVYRLIEEMKGRVTDKKNLFNKFTRYDRAFSFSRKGHEHNLKYPHSTILLDKEYSIRIKENEIDSGPPLELIEFRVFRSEKNMEILMDHALYALVVVMKGILAAWDKTDEHGVTNIDSVFRDIELPRNPHGGTRRSKKKMYSKKSRTACKKLKNKRK